MYKIIEQFHPLLKGGEGAIVYTILDDNNKKVVATMSKKYAEYIIKNIKDFEKDLGSEKPK